MLISVVIPTHNRRVLLVRAVRSALAQGGPVEIVVVDDGSNDGTGTALAGFDSDRVRYVRTEHHGVAHARNLGAKVSGGEALAFLDDDDELDARWADSLRDALTSDEDVAVVCCGVLQRNAHEVEARVRPGAHGLSYRSTGVTFTTGSYLVRRDVFLAAGGFDEGLGAYQHGELALRIFDVLDARHARVAAVDDLLVTVHRSHPLRRPRNHPARLRDSTLRIVERHRDRLSTMPSLLADYLGIAGVAAVRLGRGAEARRLFTSSFRAAPSARRAGRVVLGCVPPLGRRVWAVDAWRAAAPTLDGMPCSPP